MKSRTPSYFLLDRFSEYRAKQRIGFDLSAVFSCNYKSKCYNCKYIEPLLYILFRVALGQTEGCFYTILPVSAKCCFAVRFITLTRWRLLIKST
nr:MAG TPA: hypothetical protein [Caudoviricetes sp.]